MFMAMVRGGAGIGIEIEITVRAVIRDRVGGRVRVEGRVEVKTWIGLGSE